MKRKRLLTRLHVLYEPHVEGPRACMLKGNHVSMLPTGREVYKLVVVDEVCCGILQM